MANREFFLEVYALYQKGGASAVEQYAEAHAEKFLPEWSWCAPCEAVSPSFHTFECAVCGSLKGRVGETSCDAEDSPRLWWQEYGRNTRSPEETESA